MASGFRRRSGKRPKTYKLRFCRRKRRPYFNRMYGKRHGYLETPAAGHAFKMVFRYRPKLCICGIFCRKKTVAVQPRRHFALANRSQRKHCKRSFARPRRQSFCCRQKFGKLLRFERKTQMDHRTACRKRFAAYSDERRQHTVHSFFYQKRSEHGHTHIALRRTD